ncbi:MAG: hypothetical protein JRD88_09015, partial [Deltaproteobacteria bacterium]|nr:hypothetical protein [Deltaproteobacteria bacterium]
MAKAGAGTDGFRPAFAVPAAELRAFKMLEHACPQNKRFFTLFGTALLISFSSILPSDTGFCIAQESEIAPLAARSLLLDGQVLGQRVVVVGERGHILI